MNRSELKAGVRAVLGLASDDPLASDAVLNPIINQAYQQVVTEIAATAPDALGNTDTIAMSGGAGTTPTDLHQIRVLRETDQDGAELWGGKVPWAELPYTSNAYAVVGIQAPYTLYVSDDVTAPTIWVQYIRGAGANDLSADTTVPALVPAPFHDVIYLDACFAAALGGEQRIPPDIKERTMDRKAALRRTLALVGGPGGQSRTRLVAGQGPWP